MSGFTEEKTTGTPCGRRAVQSEVSGRLEGAGQTVDLRLQEFGRSLIPQDEVGQLDFSRQRQLLGDSQLGEHTRETALLQSS